MKSVSPSKNVAILWPYCSERRSCSLFCDFTLASQLDKKYVKSNETSENKYCLKYAFSPLDAMKS